MATKAGADAFSPPPPPPDTRDSGTPVPTIVPQQGQVVRDQMGGAGRYSRALIPKSFSLTVARQADDAKPERIPGNVLMVLAAQGGVIPDDARISIGGSDYFPLIEGFVYETDEPFDGYLVYWPTASAGVTLWILAGFGSARRTGPVF